METVEFMRIMDEIKSLKEDIKIFENKSKPIKDLYNSESTGELFTALAKAQAQYRSVGNNRENPYFKNNYADMHAIMKSVMPALNSNGLAFLQQIRINDDGATMLHTMVTHSSGQWIESRSRIVPAKNDAQSLGSTLTYMKRYAAMSLLGITVDQDKIDDDAEVAMVDARQIIAKGPSTAYNPKEQSHEVITKEQLEELEYELQECPDLAEEVLDKMNIASLADIPKTRFRVCMDRIREIKNARKGIVKK